MSVTDPVYERNDYAPNRRSAFGPIVSGFEVEHAVSECVRIWIRDYLAEIERRRRIEVESHPPFRSRVQSGSIWKLPEDQLPALLISSPGLDVRGGRVEVRGDGGYTARWRIEAGAVVSVRGNRQAVKLARFYTAALRALLVQQLPDPRWCEINVRRVEWTNERYRVLDVNTERTQATGVVDLTVEVSDVTNWQMGPATPMFGPTDPFERPDEMDLPEVERVEVEVDRVASNVSLSDWQPSPEPPPEPPPEPVVVPDYRDIVLDTPDLHYYWTLGDQEGTVARDSVDANHGTYSENFTLGQPGIPGSDESAVALSVGRMVTPNPTAYNAGMTGEIWFRSTGAQMLICVAMGSYLFLNGAGQIVLRVWTDAVAESRVTSSGSYNDGEWHYVAAGFNPSYNLALFVDGEPVAENSNSHRIAQGDPWTLGGTDQAGLYLARFVGTVAHFAAYKRLLTPAEVSSHYEAGTG